MENKDTNTNYQKVVRGQKVRNCRNYNRYNFFACDLYSDLLTMQWFGSLDVKSRYLSVSLGLW